MRNLALIAALGLAAPAAAQDGAVAAFEWLDISATAPASEPVSATGLAPLMEQAPDWARLDDDRLLIATGREPISGSTPTMIGRDVATGEYSASTLLDYAALREGDIAGLAAHAGPAQWISIQVERIEPADLVAVRLRNGDASSPAGRLIYTTALPGSYGQRVRLRIDADGGRYRLLFAPENGLWQILAEDIAGPGGPGEGEPILIGLFGMDGADPPAPAGE